MTALPKASPPVGRQITFPLPFGQIAIITSRSPLSPDQVLRLKRKLEDALATGKPLLIFDTGLGFELIAATNEGMHAQFFERFGDV